MLGPEWHIVTTPKILRQYYQAIAEGKSKQSLLVVGPTSTGKTEIAREIFNFVHPHDNTYPSEKHRHALYFDGGGSPAQLYTYAYRHQNRTLFIDDPTSTFIRTSDGKRLWKQLFATTNQERQITWETKAHFIEQEELENAFWTKSTVIAVCNEFKAMGPDIEAIKSRAMCVYYNPDLATRLEYAASWASKEKGGLEIIKWLQEQFKKGRIRHIHQRHVFHALGLKQTQEQGIRTRDWKEYLVQSTQDESLEEDPGLDREIANLIRWVGEHTLCGVFTAFKLKKNIRHLREPSHCAMVIETALKKGLIHRLPTPPRPRGSRVRMPESVYCLGPAPASAPAPPLSVIGAEGTRHQATKSTKSTPRLIEA